MFVLRPIRISKNFFMGLNFYEVEIVLKNSAMKMKGTVEMMTIDIIK